MRIYNEDKLRKRISVLRIGKIMNQLNNKGKIELISCEMLLKSLIKDKNLKDFDKFINELIRKNGTTKY